jgi:hypothetical protein
MPYSSRGHVLTPVALCIATAISAGARAEQQPPTLAQDKAIWVAAWGDVPGNHPHITSMVVLGGDFRPDRDNNSLDADQLAQRLLSRPAGRRALLVQRYCHGFWGAAADAAIDANGNPVWAPWADDALRQIGRDWPRVLALTKHCGATIDLVVADFEESGAFSAWSAPAAMIGALRSDQRWRRPSLGLPALADTLSGLSAATSDDIRDSRKPYLIQWNAAIERLSTSYMNEAIWKPAKQVFPHVQGSNYDGYRTDAQIPPCRNGHLQPHENVFGSHSAPALYGEVEGLATRYVDHADPTRIRPNSLSPSDTKIERTPWTGLLSNQQTARSCLRAGSPLMPWIANPSYDGSPPGKGLACYPMDIRCWDENIRHSALLGIQTFLWWRKDSSSTNAETERLESLMADINANAGGKVFRTLVSRPLAFNASWVLSGAIRQDGKAVWRVSVAPSCPGIVNRSNGQVLKPAEDSLGIWIVTETDQEPAFDPINSPSATAR